MRKQLEEALEVGDVLLDVQPKPLDTLSEDGMAVGPESESTPEEEVPADQMMSKDPEWSFDDEIFVGGREKTKLMSCTRRKILISWPCEILIKNTLSVKSGGQELARKAGLKMMWNQVCQSRPTAIDELKFLKMMTRLQIILFL